MFRQDIDAKGAPEICKDLQKEAGYRARLSSLQEKVATIL